MWLFFVWFLNMGYVVIVDFFIICVVVVGILSNYDMLIERCVWDYGVDFCGLFDGDEVIVDIV